MRVIEMGLYPPPYGGVSIHLFRFKKYLEENGIKCFIIDWSGISHKDKSTKYDIYTLSGNRLLSILQLFRFIWKIKPDIIHAHISGGSKFIWMYPLIKIMNSKKVITIHNSLVASRQYLWYRPILIKIIKEFDYIIATNELIKEYLIKAINKKQHISVIPAYIPPSSYELTFNDEMLNIKIDNLKAKYEKIMMVAGYMNKSYGIHLAIDAFIKLNERNVALIVVSYTIKDSEYEKEIKEKLAKLKERIVLLENLPPQNFLNVLSKIDIFIRTQDIDGDSVAIREALFFGKKTIASDATVRPRGVILYKKGNMESLIQAIKRALCEDKAKKKEDLDENNIPLYAKRILEIYKYVTKLY